MSAPNLRVHVDGPALIQRVPDEGLILIEPLRIVRDVREFENRRHRWLSRNRIAA